MVPSHLEKCGSTKENVQAIEQHRKKIQSEIVVKLNFYCREVVDGVERARDPVWGACEGESVKTVLQEKLERNLAPLIRYEIPESNMPGLLSKLCGIYENTYHPGREDDLYDLYEILNFPEKSLGLESGDKVFVLGMDMTKLVVLYGKLELLKEIIKSSETQTEWCLRQIELANSVIKNFSPAMMPGDPSGILQNKRLLSNFFYYPIFHNILEQHALGRLLFGQARQDQHAIWNQGWLKTIGLWFYSQINLNMLSLWGKIIRFCIKLPFEAVNAYFNQQSQSYDSEVHINSSENNINDSEDDIDELESDNSDLEEDIDRVEEIIYRIENDELNNDKSIFQVFINVILFSIFTTAATLIFPILIVTQIAQGITSLPFNFIRSGIYHLKLNYQYLKWVDSLNLLKDGLVFFAFVVPVYFNLMLLLPVPTIVGGGLSCVLSLFLGVILDVGILGVFSAIFEIDFERMDAFFKKIVASILLSSLLFAQFYFMQAFFIYSLSTALLIATAAVSNHFIHRATFFVRECWGNLKDFIGKRLRNNDCSNSIVLDEKVKPILEKEKIALTRTLMNYLQKTGLSDEKRKEIGHCLTLLHKQERTDVDSQHLRQLAEEYDSQAIEKNPSPSLVPLFQQKRVLSSDTTQEESEHLEAQLSMNEEVALPKMDGCQI